MHEYLHKYFENIKKNEIFFIHNMRLLGIREPPPPPPPPPVNATDIYWYNFAGRPVSEQYASLTALRLYSYLLWLRLLLSEINMMMMMIVVFEGRMFETLCVHHDIVVIWPQAQHSQDILRLLPTSSVQNANTSVNWWTLEKVENWKSLTTDGHREWSRHIPRSRAKCLRVQ